MQGGCKSSRNNTCEGGHSQPCASVSPQTACPAQTSKTVSQLLWPPVAQYTRSAISMQACARELAPRSGECGYCGCRSREGSQLKVGPFNTRNLHGSSCFPGKDASTQPSRSDVYLDRCCPGHRALDGGTAPRCCASTLPTVARHPVMTQTLSTCQYIFGLWWHVSRTVAGNVPVDHLQAHAFQAPCSS